MDINDDEPKGRCYKQAGRKESTVELDDEYTVYIVHGRDIPIMFSSCVYSCVVNLPASLLLTNVTVCLRQASSERDHVGQCTEDPYTAALWGSVTRFSRVLSLSLHFIFVPEFTEQFAVE